MPFKNKKERSEYERQRAKERYRDDPEYKRRIIACTKDRIAKNKAYVYQVKKVSKCSSCSENHPACLDFHHVDPKSKEMDICKAIKRMSTKRLIAEMKKCSVLCSNCHRKLHWVLP